MSETWAPIAGYEGSYEVSDQGRVRSLDRTITVVRPGEAPRCYVRRGQVLKQGTVKGRNHRYLRVSLSTDERHAKVHLLVLTTFAGPRPEGLMGCHVNGDRQDNRLANLYWGTNSDNEFDKVRHGTHNQTRKQRCRQGHAFDAVNTAWRVRPTGRIERRCRECARDWNRQAKERQAVR